MVILVHVWSELWYSWRHQINPLACAGFRVVARPRQWPFRTQFMPGNYSISGDAASDDNGLTGREDGGLLEILTDPEVFLNCMTAADLDYFVDQFSASGFRSPLNRYRNQDRDHEMLPQIGRARITQPACFIAGSKDMVRNLVPGHDLYATPDAICDDLRIAEIIEGKGHWIQQEAPEEVNAHLLVSVRTGLRRMKIFQHDMAFCYFGE
ncbi:MAG: pimeloyl-ACP methyl ester carboxylesterase [Paracoccaceae bacterium]